MNKSKYFPVILLIIVCFISLNLVSASEAQVNYQIIKEKVLVEITYGNVPNLELELPSNYEAFESNADYELSNEILLIKSGENIEVKYITSSLIDKSKKNYFFILAEPIENADISLYLPEGAILSEPRIISPSNAQISTDGRRVLLKWDEFKDEQIIVAYEFIEDDNWIPLIIIGILVIIIVIGYNIVKRKFNKELIKVREKSKQKKTRQVKEGEITKNLFEDEKKIVSYLLTKKNNECWTKEIIRDLEISKVKLSRKLRSLEAKEVIKRIPYGNENKIRLLK